MKTHCNIFIMALGLAFCIGCGDTSNDQGKPTDKKMDAKASRLADNDEPAAGGSENAHGMADPHGMVNPHGEMTATGEAAPENNGKLDADNLHWTVPKTWIRKSVSPMAKSVGGDAEYAVPKVESDPKDLRLTVSHAGGTMDANIARWKGQFNKVDSDKTETLDAGGVKITLVVLDGTYNDAPPMAGGGVARPDYRMMAAVFQLPGEETFHFIKCYGPKKTMDAKADEIKDFIKSLKVDK